MLTRSTKGGLRSIKGSKWRKTADDASSNLLNCGRRPSSRQNSSQRWKSFLPTAQALTRVALPQSGWRGPASDGMVDPTRWSASNVWGDVDEVTSWQYRDLIAISQRLATTRIATPNLGAWDFHVGLVRIGFCEYDNVSAPIGYAPSWFIP